MRIDCDVIAEQTWLMIEFKAHNLLRIDCDVVSGQTWLGSRFKAHNPFRIECYVIVKQASLRSGFKAHNLLRVDFTLVKCEWRCTLKRHLDNDNNDVVKQNSYILLLY